MIVGLVEAFAGFYIDPELKQAIWFLIFLAVLVVRPTGTLWPEFDNAEQHSGQ